MRLRSFATTTAAIALGANVLVAAPAGAAPSKAVKPSKEQKAAVIKGWSTWDGGEAYTGPQKCIKVRLAKSNKHLAGLTSNAAKYPKVCASYAFDGAAILYGHKKTWFLLTAGSGLSKAECKATAHLLGDDAWHDLAAFAEILGCETV